MACKILLRRALKTTSIRVNLLKAELPGRPHIGFWYSDGTGPSLEGEGRARERFETKYGAAAGLHRVSISRAKVCR